MNIFLKSLSVSVAIIALSGCGGNKEKIQDPVDRVTYESYYPDSYKKASNFLQRGTFGPKIEEIGSLAQSGDYEGWVDNQFSLPQSSLLKWATDNAKPLEGVSSLASDYSNWDLYDKTLVYLQRDGWYVLANSAEDQLRHRVATALSEIFVVSEVVIKNKGYNLMDFYDVLSKNAFGNFENLLQEVTYHPAMGRYLSYIYNKKADPSTGTLPDENYAREFLQLFTIGLHELNLDGTEKKDVGGKAIPTYFQKDIEETARVFTGLVLTQLDTNFEKFNTPLSVQESIHDTGDKIIMNQSLAGSDTRTEINAFIHMVFNHPNVGPFIARQLIQRLVTSNPSPEYVKKVALAFNDNGQGVRGDMKAVIKAVLLSPEASIGGNDGQTFGKLKEPVMFVSQLLRSMNASKGENFIPDENNKSGNVYSYQAFNLKRLRDKFLQHNVLHAPSVFNYFKPTDGPYTLVKEGVVAPEFEVYNFEIHKILMAISSENQYYRDLGLTVRLNFPELIKFVEDKEFEKMIAYLDVLLLGGKLSEESRLAVSKYVLSNTNLDPETLCRDTIGLIILSPDYAVQK